MCVCVYVYIYIYIYIYIHTHNMFVHFASVDSPLWHNTSKYIYGHDFLSIVLNGLVLWHINQCGLFNAKSSLYIYIRYIWFGLIGFYGISTIVGYLIPNPLYTYILDIYDLVWLGFMAYQPFRVISCQILFIHVYQIHMICKQILLITFLNEPELIFFAHS